MSQMPNPPRGMADYLLRASHESDAPWSSRLLVEQLEAQIRDLEARTRDLEAELADPDAALKRAVDGKPAAAVIEALIKRHRRGKVDRAYRRVLQLQGYGGAARVPINQHSVVFTTFELCRAACGDTIQDAATRIARAGGLPQIRDRARPADRRRVFETAPRLRAAYYRAERALKDVPPLRACCIKAAQADVERHRWSGEGFDKWLSRSLKDLRELYAETGMP